MKCETHNHPTAISPFPGAATGAGGEIRDEGATGRGAQAEGGPGRLLGVAPAHSRARCSRGRQASSGKPGRIASALDIMLDGPIGAASFNNEFGRPNLCGYFRTFEQRSTASCAATTSRSCSPAASAASRAAHVAQEAALPAGALLDPARRPGHADRHGRRRRLVDGRRRQHRGPRLRLGAARQRRDPAPRAGGHRPLLAARRGEPDPLDPRRRRRRPVERAARARARAPGAARSSTCARSRRGQRHVAARDLVQRGAGALRARRSLRRDLDAFGRSASASAARSRCSARATDDGRLVVEDPQFGDKPVDVDARGDPRQAAEDAARREARCAAARTACRSRRSSLEDAVAPRAAPSGGRRQDLPRSRSATAPSAACARAIRSSVPGRCRSPTAR
mgnify:CR=1 FL=1